MHVFKINSNYQLENKNMCSKNFHNKNFKREYLYNLINKYTFNNMEVLREKTPGPGDHKSINNIIYQSKLF